MAADGVDSHACICYVGGLAEEMTEAALRAAFTPFGEIREAKIPTDLRNPGHHRGFGFVEFESPEDCKEAIDNMHESECFGRVLTVNASRAAVTRTAQRRQRPLWADDFFYKQTLEKAGLNLSKFPHKPRNIGASDASYREVK